MRDWTVEIDRNWDGYTVYGWRRQLDSTDWARIAYRVVCRTFGEALAYGKRIVERGKPLMAIRNRRFVCIGYANTGAPPAIAGL